MPNPTQFGVPTIPVTVNIPTAQLPQPTVPTTQPQPPVVAPQHLKVAPATFYAFPWKPNRK